MTYCVASGHMEMFKQWVARVGQVFADEVLGLWLAVRKAKLAWTENQTDGISNCIKQWNPLSLHGNQGSDFSDHTLGLRCRQPETENKIQHPAMPGRAVTLLHIVKSANTYLALPECKALSTSLVFIKGSQYLLKYYDQDCVSCRKINEVLSNLYHIQNCISPWETFYSV